VDTSVSERLTKFILAHNMKKTTSHLLLLVNSCGGDLTEAFAIIDIMNQSRIPVYTNAFGQISSCGLMIFMAGAKGQRSISPNTVIMSHQWSTELVGKYFELESSKKDITQTRNRVVNHYKQCTTLTEKEILKKLLPQHDVFLTPEDAVKYGLADRIM
jgi:ATP-dependent Clp protease protease subunit